MLKCFSYDKLSPCAHAAAENCARFVLDLSTHAASARDRAAVVQDMDDRKPG
jgi:hypothetical protein